MIIEKNITKYIIFKDESVSYALTKISGNKSGVIFVVESNGFLAGLITDGDIRRWLLKSKTMNLERPASEVMNHNFTALSESSSTDQIRELFSERIRYIPLVDTQQRLVAIAMPGQSGIAIGDFTIGDDEPSFVIAEIGNNHNGSLQLAKELIDAAVEAGADCAKFQMRDLGSMYRERTARDASEDLGAQYTLDLLARFQLSNDELFQAFDYCKEKGILPMCTPWDKASLNLLERYGMPGYKVASADLTNSVLIEEIAKTRKPMICSTGMSSEGEIKQAVSTLQNQGAKFVLLHCNSTYPAPFKDINMKYLTKLQEIGGGCPVGYSGHERGYAIPVAAVAMGAKVIEKHFTFDRNMEGNDHRVSLLPQEFKRMVGSIREVEASLGSSSARRVSQGEMMNREVLGKSVLAAVSISAGETITEKHLDIRSPGNGLPPSRMHELIGAKIERHMSKGDFFFPSDVEKGRITARSYKFRRPFGVPVRYHDAQLMAEKSNFDLLEFHLSYKDMDLVPADFLDPNGYDMDFAVHSPELFANDHIMDLCADDDEYRARSIIELQRVVDATRALKPYFHRAGTPVIIVNAGGSTMDGFMPDHERSARYKLIADSLSHVDQAGVEITFQTMPPFPWLFGGQRFHNLFMDPDEIAEFCLAHKMRITLDVSHSMLYCNLKHLSFSEFLDKVAPFAAHLHIVDADGVDAEGLQIHSGSIDFVACSEKLLRHCPKASFVPEIWQGHKNEGEGFWIALEKLEPIL